MTKLNQSFETKTKFASRVGVSKGRISQLVTAGLPVRDDGKIDIESGLTWMESNLDPAKRNKGGVKREVIRESGPSLSEVRRLHLIVQIERAKLALKQERGELIDAQDATSTIFARARAERDAHIAWVQRTAPVLAGELGCDAAKMFTALDRLMREHLEHLANTPLDVLKDA